MEEKFGGYLLPSPTGGSQPEFSSSSVSFLFCISFRFGFSKKTLFVLVGGTKTCKDVHFHWCRLWFFILRSLKKTSKSNMFIQETHEIPLELTKNSEGKILPYLSLIKPTNSASTWDTWKEQFFRLDRSTFLGTTKVLRFPPTHQRNVPNLGEFQREKHTGSCTVQYKQASNCDVFCFCSSFYHMENGNPNKLIGSSPSTNQFFLTMKRLKCTNLSQF